MEKTMQIARYRGTPYTVNYLTNGGIKAYQWSGSKGNKVDIKAIPADVVDWLLMNSRTFAEGELVIVDESPEAKEVVENIEDKDSYDSNTHSRDQVIKLLEGNAKTLEKELKKITVDAEKRFFIEVAKDIKLDSNSKLKMLADWAGVPQDVLFSE